MAATPGAVYFAHMRDGPMIRIRLPGGEISARQLRAIADLAETGGNGLIDLTNRANLQVRGLERITLKSLEGTLGKAGLLDFAPRADRLRNILADPLAGLDETEIIDSRPVVVALDAAIQKTPELTTLLPEFQFVVDNGGRSGIAGVGHDVGLIAELVRGVPLYRLSLAGNPTPLAALPEHAAQLAIAAARAALIFAGPSKLQIMKRIRQFGWQPETSASRAAAAVRLALLLNGCPESRVRRLVRSIPVEDIARLVAELADSIVIRLEGPGLEPHLRPSVGIAHRGKSGLAACGLGVAMGRLDAKMLLALADLAGDFGNGAIRLSPWQVVYLTDVEAERAEALLAKARRLGFATDPAFVRLRVVACPGRTGCRRARLNVRQEAKEVLKSLTEAFYDQPDDNSRAMTIHISGCTKGCAHRGVSDLFVVEGRGSYRVYENCPPAPSPAGQCLASSIKPNELPRLINDLVRKKLNRPECR